MYQTAYDRTSCCTVFSLRNRSDKCIEAAAAAVCLDRTMCKCIIYATHIFLCTKNHLESLCVVFWKLSELPRLTHITWCDPLFKATLHCNGENGWLFRPLDGCSFCKKKKSFWKNKENFTQEKKEFKPNLFFLEVISSDLERTANTSGW